MKDWHEFCIEVIVQAEAREAKESDDEGILTIPLCQMHAAQLIKDAPAPYDEETQRIGAYPIVQAPVDMCAACFADLEFLAKSGQYPGLLDLIFCECCTQRLHLYLTFLRVPPEELSDLQDMRMEE